MIRARAPGIGVRSGSELSPASDGPALSLRASDVARVEVYPLGATPRPGYGTSAHGLILVFLRGAHQ